MKLVLLSVVIGLSLASLTRAVSPPPDGGYPNDNTAEGEDALFSLNTDTAASNTAVGFEAMYNTSSGQFNTSVGANSMMSNTTGNFNTAVGFTALATNTTGTNNTALGESALGSSSTTSNNTAVGSFALTSDSTGTGNAATGGLAMILNTTGNSNTADGFQALLNNVSGSDNTAVGLSALGSNRKGNNNTAVGESALFNNTASNNIAVGESAGSNLTKGGGNIEIGNKGAAADANTIRIGRTESQTATFIAGINGATVASGVAVLIDSTGHLGTLNSSASYKEAIKPMKDASAAILSLRPVTFRYKKELDPKGVPQFGLVAEEVAKVDPDLVAKNEQGKPYTVRYEAVNAMLLNEFQKEHQKVETLEATLTKLQSAMEKMNARLEAKDSGARLAEGN